MTLICATIRRARDITVLALTVVAFGGCEREAPSATAKADIKTLRSEVEVWRIEHPKSTECPSIAVLQRDDAMKPDQRVLDPWKHAYAVMCSHDAEGSVVGFVVGSAGADGRWGTADDLIASSR